MEPKSETKSNEDKKVWTPPVVEDYDLISSTGSGTTGTGQDAMIYS
jgi:hypothetical protein